MSDNKNIENILGKFLPKFLIENDQNKNLNIEIVDLIIESPQIYEISTTVRKNLIKNLYKKTSRVLNSRCKRTNSLIEQKFEYYSYFSR